LNESLQVSRDYQDHFDTIARNVLAKYLYFFIIALVGLFVITFLMLKIMPVFVKMFEEFELELPAITQFVVAVSAVVNRTVFLFLPTVLFLVSIPLVTGLGYYFGWSRYELPLVQRFWLRCDTALVLRALALAVRQQRPLGPAIYQLAGLYPRASVGRRLERASGLINNGASWTQALLAAGVIRDAERAVLNSAERVGNLAWALDEMADSTLRRFVHRLRIVIDLLFPLMVLAFSATVAMLALGAILPLVAMIQGLS
jgi:type IV pilus assembly protein PilC